MKVALFAPSDLMLYYHRLSLAQRLQNAGHDVLLISSNGRAVPLMKQAGWRWREVDLPRGLASPWWELKAIYRLRKIVEEERPDLIHAFTPKGNAYAGIATVNTGISVVYGFTGLGTAFTEASLLYWLVRNLLVFIYKRCAHRAECHSLFENRDDANLMITLGAVPSTQTTVVAGAGISLDEYSPATAEPHSKKIQVLLATRLLRSKGVYEFAEAARILHEERAPVEFVLAGWTDPDNPMSIKLSEVDAWTVEGILTYLGTCDDMPGLLRSCDIVALPSYREGLPRILIEAAAIGKPLVATDVPGCREAVVDGYNGRLIPPRNANSLAQAIRELASNRDQMDEYGRNSRKLASERFDEKVILNQIVAIYQSLVY